MKKIEKKVYTVEEVDELKKWFDNQTPKKEYLEYKNQFVKESVAI